MSDVEAEPGRRFVRTSNGEKPAATVLYIEDDSASRGLVASMLRYRGRVELLTAAEGREGLELARERRPDLILLDLLLPDLSGAEVLADLRSDERTREIPVIVVTVIEEADSELPRGAEIDAHVTKPLDDVEAFLEIVEDSLTPQAA